MAYVFTEHAKRRMRQRGISESRVRETLEQPEMAWPDKEIKDRRIHVRTYGRRRLKVVWIPENRDAIIVSAMWLEEEGGRP